MKKIMFNDRYGLTAAVLQGRKTMTRRMVPQSVLNAIEKYQEDYYSGALESISTKDAILNMCTGEKMFKCIYNIGEVVAVAQSYKDLGYTKEWVEQHISPNPNAKWNDPFEKKYPGWSNKMFVPAELNKAHQIQITDIKVEKMQDISDKDCFKEGITMITEGKIEIGNGYGWDTQIDALKRDSFFTPRAAFAALIDKVSGKGTWESNPWVFAYSFKLLM